MLQSASGASAVWRVPESHATRDRSIYMGRRENWCSALSEIFVYYQAGLRKTGVI